METKENKLGTMPIGRLLFQMALPAITAQIINLLYNLVDRMYIGHIPEVGATALTGMGIVLPAIMLVGAFSSLVGFGGAPRAAIAMGKGDHAEAERILGNSASAVVLISILLTAVFLVFKTPFLYLFGASEETFPYADAYLGIYAWGTIFVQIALGLNPFITSQGFSKTSMQTVMIGAVLNIILDPVFIFGFGMGVRGAALATILSQAVSAVWVLRFLTGKKAILNIRKENLPLKAHIILPTLALGVSPFIMSATESLISICFNTSLLKYGGNIAVGAMTILSSVMQFSMLPLQGLCQGMQPIVSFNYGAGDAQRVKRTFKLTLIASLVFSGTLCLSVELFPQVFAAMFTSDAALIDYASWALRIYMAASCIFGAQIACQQTFLALGKAKQSLFLAVWRKIILLIPLIYILPALLQDKVFAVFLAEPAADTVAVLTTVTMFIYTFRRIIAQMEETKQKPLDISEGIE